MPSSESQHSYRPRVSRKMKRFLFLTLVTVTSIAVLVFIGKNHLVHNRIFKNGVFYFYQAASDDEHAVHVSNGLKHSREQEVLQPEGTRNNILTERPKESVRGKSVGNYKDDDDEKVSMMKNNEHDKIPFDYHDDAWIVPAEMLNGDGDDPVDTGQGMTGDTHQKAGDAGGDRVHPKDEAAPKGVKTQNIKTVTTGEKDADQNDVNEDASIAITNEPVDVQKQEQKTIKTEVGTEVLIHNNAFQDAVNLTEILNTQLDRSDTVNREKILGTDNTHGESDHTENESNDTQVDTDKTMNEAIGNEAGNGNAIRNVENPTPVLLLTYLRSGSTLTADIIQQVPGVFYAYEPLKPYLRSHTVTRPEDLGYFTMDGICSIFNSTCRSTSQTSEEPDVVIADLVRYYGCDLDHFTRHFLWSSYSTSVRRYKMCLKTPAKFKTTKDICFKQCFDSAKSLKTIRLSMDIVEILMQRLTHLKVVHLLRDPRGMIQSRKTGGFVKKWMNLKTVARSVCQRFERDIEIAMILKRKYHGRLKTYMYEQIAEHPLLASASLFKFLGLTAPENFGMWLHNHTAAGNRSSFYGTSRPNSTITASAWRRKMSYNDVIKIDQECLKYYNYTGILRAQSEKSLKDLKFPLRSSSPLFGDFL